MNGHERPYGFERGFPRKLRGLRMPDFNTRCSSSTQASFLSQPSTFVHFRVFLYHTPFNRFVDAGRPQSLRPPRQSSTLSIPFIDLAACDWHSLSNSNYDLANSDYISFVLL